MVQWLTQAAKYLLGLIFLVFGANGLALFTLGQGFIPMPPPSDAMAPIFNGFVATGYLMQTVKAIEVLCGLLLIAQRFVNLAVVLLGPIVFNIFAIHLFADPQGLPIGLAVVVLWAIIFMGQWKDLKVLIKA